MRHLEFRVGAKVRLDGEEAILVDFADKKWVLHFPGTGKAQSWLHGELLQFYSDGRLKGIGSRGPDHELAEDPPTQSIRDLSPATQKSLRIQMKVIEEIDALRRQTSLGFAYEAKDPFTGLDKKRTALEHVLAKVAYDEGLKRQISRATYYGWKKKFGVNGDPLDMIPVLDGRGRTRSLHIQAIRIMNEEVNNLVEGCRAQQLGGVHPTLRKSQLHDTISDRIDSECPGVPKPSRATIYRVVDALPAFQRDIINVGLRRAQNNYRMIHGRDAPEFCLDECEYDESVSRLFLVCEDTMIVLGRAIFSWFICVTTRMPLGFYIGFEPMSDVSTMAAWKHAVLPKNYVKTHFPDIRNTWDAHGNMRSIRFDNGLTQHGETVRETAFDLCQARLIWAPPYVPWFKSAVENFHHQLNDGLLDLLPGCLPHKSFRHDEFDPSVNACIGMQTLNWIVHKWLIDIHIQKPLGILKQSAAQAWTRSFELSPVKPSLPASTENLEVLFGLRRRGRLDHRGVRCEDLGELQYLGDWMEQFRKDFGNTAVEVNIYAPDMGRIHVRHPVYGWLPAQCKQSHLVAGKPLHYVKRLIDHATERFKSTEEPALIAAKKELRELAAFALQHAKSIALNKAIARTMGIGSDSLFAGHNHAGEISHSTGHFADKPINPLKPPAPNDPKPRKQAKRDAETPPRQRRLPRPLKTNQSTDGAANG